MRQLAGIVRHRATALLLAAVLAAIGSAAAAPTSGAQAYPLPGNGPVVAHTKTYAATWTFRDGSLRRCVTYTVTGSIKYDTQGFSRRGPSSGRSSGLARSRRSRSASVPTTTAGAAGRRSCTR